MVSEARRATAGFENYWKAVLPYPGWLVPNKSYSAVIQWQGKEIRNQGRCILEVRAGLFGSPEVRKQLLSKVLSYASGHLSTLI